MASYRARLRDGLAHLAKVHDLPAPNPATWNEDWRIPYKLLPWFAAVPACDKGSSHEVLHDKPLRHLAVAFLTLH